MIFTVHAMRQMAARGFTEDDVANAFRTIRMFEARPDYSVNVWGHARDGRPMRVTWVPEVLLVITVAERNQTTIRDILAAKAAAS